jgi:Protein of unknown function (DUF2510)
MTLPHSPGWYDDPDGSGALRYFDGQAWTGQRKRKNRKPDRPPQPGAYAPSSPAVPVDPYLSANPYPMGPGDPYGGVPPTTPANPYGFSPAGPAQETPLSRLKAGMAVGTDRITGIVTAGIGVALIVTSFLTWGRVSAAGQIEDGVFGSFSLSFPGFGDPSLTLNLSDGGTSVSGKVDSPLLRSLHSSNPGWIALALGILAIIAGVAFLGFRQRMIAAVAAATLGGIVGVICLSHILDLPSTFGNPPGVTESRFSPGVGLVAACALSFALAVVSITACIMQWRQQFNKAPY